MRHLFDSVLALVATVGLSGCGTAPVGGGAGARSSDVITRAEIQSSASDSAYEAVERLRRDWLVSRGPTSATDPTPVLPKVFVDGLERGETQALYAISANVIEEIRFIGSSEATLLHGQGYLGGIIQVITEGSERGRGARAIPQARRRRFPTGLPDGLHSS